MLVNQFRSTIWDCAEAPSSSGHQKFQCMYPSDLESEGKIHGTAVLRAYRYSYSDGEIGKWIGIMFGIIFVYRILGYLVLVAKKH